MSHRLALGLGRPWSVFAGQSYLCSQGVVNAVHWVPRLGPQGFLADIVTVDVSSAERDPSRRGRALGMGLARAPC